jgi:hypothetical protein
MRRHLCRCAASSLLALLALPGLARAAGDATPYQGIGTWISLYSKTWALPDAAVQASALRGVTTIYLETGRSTSAAPIERPTQTAAFIDAAHAAGLRIVAWYYPTFVRWSVDADRMVATASFRTPDGQGFDAVAADIEDATVRSGVLRNARFTAFTNRIVRALPDESWGAITYPPIGLDLNPHAWPAFPWAFVSQRYTAILPMAYWRSRTHTAAGAAWYAAGNIAALKVLTRDPNVLVHMIGSGGTTPAEATAFASASLAAGAIGVSLYPYDRTGAGEASALLRAVSQSPIGS